MKEPSKVEKILAEAHAVGQVDSQGEFTVDRLSEARKLSSSSALAPGDYTCQILQLAHSLKASGPVEFELGRSRMRATFSFPRLEDAAPEAVASALQFGPSNGVARYLVSATHGARASRVVWAVDKVGEVLYQDQRPIYKVVSGESPELWSATFSVERRAGFLGSIFSKEAALEHSALHSRCQYGQLPLTVDRRELKRGWPRSSRPFRSGSWTDYLGVAHYYLMEGYVGVESTGLPALGFPVNLDDSREVEDGFYRHRAFYLSKNGEYFGTPPYHLKFLSGITEDSHPPMYSLYTTFIDCQPGSKIGAAFALPMTLAGRARVTFVIDGVATDSKDVEVGVPGLLCVASGEGLKTDLTGFSVVEDQAYLKRIQQLSSAARLFMERVFGHESDYRSHVCHRWANSDNFRLEDYHAANGAQDVNKQLRARLASVKKHLKL